VKNAKDLANLRKKRKLKRESVIERRKHSPYYQANSYERAKHHIFKLIANRTNQRCSKGKIRAKDLWRMAKKQALCCPISGEKLTRENISLDHIIPIANGGTNALSNLRLVTLKVNTAKHTMSDAEFFSFCQNIVNRNIVG
jgi:5-methylcytosine-specific restriction endonuclease McrA